MKPARYWLISAGLVAAILTVVRINRPSLAPHPWSLEFNSAFDHFTIRENGRLKLERAPSLRPSHPWQSGLFVVDADNSDVNCIFKKASTARFLNGAPLRLPKDPIHSEIRTIILSDALGLPFHVVCYGREDIEPQEVVEVESSVYSMLEKYFGKVTPVPVL